MPKNVTIGSEAFSAIQSAHQRCKKLLYAGGVNDRITASKDVALLTALFYSRPEKVAELEGREIVGWGRVGNHQTICFAAFLDDDSHIHFSFYKSVNALAKAQNEPKAA